MKESTPARLAHESGQGPPGILEFLADLYHDMAIVSRHEGVPEGEVRESCLAFLREHAARWSEEFRWADADAERIVAAGAAAIDRALREYDPADPRFGEAAIEALRASWRSRLRWPATGIAGGAGQAAIAPPPRTAVRGAEALPARIELETYRLFGYRHRERVTDDYDWSYRPQYGQAAAWPSPAAEKTARPKSKAAGRTVRPRPEDPVAVRPWVTGPLAGSPRPLPLPAVEPLRLPADPPRSLALPAAGRSASPPPADPPRAGKSRGRRRRPARRKPLAADWATAGSREANSRLPAPRKALCQETRPPEAARDDVRENTTGD